MQYIRVITLCSVFLSISAFADSVGKVDSFAFLKNEGGAKKHPPRIETLMRCAENVSESYFMVRSEHLIKWQGTAGMLNGGHYPSLAVSAYVEKDPTGKSPGPGFLTLSSNQVFFTPASPPSLDNIGYLKNHVTLNLSGRIDPKWNLPIVDSRDYISPSWYYNVSHYPRGEHGEGYGAQKNFANIDPDHSEIKPSDSLTGDAADKSLNQWKSIIAERISSSPKRVESIYHFRLTDRQNIRFHSSYGIDRNIPKHPRGYALTEGEIKVVREGFCACESAFPEEVQSAREKMSDPKQITVKVFDERDQQPRKVEMSDLICGIS